MQFGQREHLRTGQQELFLADLEYRSLDSQLRQPSHAVATGQHEVDRRRCAGHESADEAGTLVVSADVVHVVDDDAHTEWPSATQLGQ